MVKMKMMNQFLIVDLSGEPYELIYMAANLDKVTCKVEPK